MDGVEDGRERQIGRAERVWAGDVRRSGVNRILLGGMLRITRRSHGHRMAEGYW